MNIVRRLPLTIAALLPGIALACSDSSLLEGTLSIPPCESQAGECVPGGKAVYDALEALDIPGEFTIGLQTSPWRMYDGEGRIVTMEDVAAAVRAKRTDSDKKVRLIGSWTAERPDGKGDTLAQRLSAALDGYPVEGSDGFLWLSPKGDMRTTRQAFSVWKTGAYSVRPGDDVMVALVPGALAQFEDRFAEDGLAEGVVQAGIGHDVFTLCPKSALAAFERAASMGSGIGACNAGLMHAETGDRTSAVTWLEKAKALGEKKADAALAAFVTASPEQGENN